MLTSCNTSDAFETHRNATKPIDYMPPFPTANEHHPKKTAAAPKQIPGTSWNILQPHEICCGCCLLIFLDLDSWASILPNDSRFHRFSGFTHAQRLQSDVEPIPRKVPIPQKTTKESLKKKHDPQKNKGDVKVV